MAQYALPYGHSELRISLPTNYTIHKIRPQRSPKPNDIETKLHSILEQPLSIRKLEAFSAVKRVGIAINDKTRPKSQPDCLRPLLDYLRALGINKSAITLFIGSGTHAPMDHTELNQMLGEEIVANYRIFVHKCDQTDMVDLGKTSFGTPIVVNKAYTNCDLKITIGNIEPHHFMGFSGGVKTAAIGLASRKTINSNHAMLIHKQARSGIFHLNPMRQDIEEIGRKMGIHFSLGTILNEEKEVLFAYFGAPSAVMNAAIPQVNAIFKTKIEEPYDLVIASPGGAPKDINFYQSQKALTHAARITRDGGWVVLLAACPEGSGSPAYEDYITSVATHLEILDHFKKGFFEIGPHKAFLIARDAVRLKIILVSNIPPEKVKSWKITPSQPTLLTPLMDWLVTQLPAKARIALLPNATRTMTELQNE